MVTSTEGSAACRKAMEDLTFACMIAGRERVRFVLEPVLGPQHALERANNIVQALTLDADEPLLIAMEMLRALPEEERRIVALQVRAAWLRQERA
jgi:hypothetical protein